MTTQDRETLGLGLMGIMLVCFTGGGFLLKAAAESARVEAQAPAVYDILRFQSEGYLTTRLVHYRGTGTCGVLITTHPMTTGEGVAAHPVPCPWTVSVPPAPVEGVRIP